MRSSTTSPAASPSVPPAEPFADPAELERERRMQKAMLDIKKKFGKNAILKGMNLEESATTMERNRQIGGHKSGE